MSESIKSDDYWSNIQQSWFLVNNYRILENDENKDFKFWIASLRFKNQSIEIPSFINRVGSTTQLMYQIYDFERCTFSTPSATSHGSLSDNDITNLFNYFYDRSILCPDNHEVDHQNRQLLYSFSAFWNTPITTKFAWESVESIDGQNHEIDSYDVIPHMTGSPLRHHWLHH